MPEAVEKARRINLAECQHVLRVLRDPACSDRTKYAMSRSFVLCKGLTLAGTWPCLKASQCYQKQSNNSI